MNQRQIATQRSTSPLPIVCDFLSLRIPRGILRGLIYTLAFVSTSASTIACRCVTYPRLHRRPSFAVGGRPDPPQSAGARRRSTSHSRRDGPHPGLDCRRHAARFFGLCSPRCLLRRPPLRGGRFYLRALGFRSRTHHATTFASGRDLQVEHNLGACRSGQRQQTLRNTSGRPRMLLLAI